MDTLRTFIAIEIPANVRASIADHINRLRRECPDVGASWTREDNLHLTLKFLGEVAITRVPALSDAAAKAARSIEPFSLLISGCGSFPSHGKPKVLWVGVSSETPADRGPQAASPLGADAGGFEPEGRTSTLEQLHTAIEDECTDADFERDSRAFHPHLTIARVRKPKGIGRLVETHRTLNFPSHDFVVGEIVVFKSELLRQGSKHTALSRHQLGTK